MPCDAKGLKASRIHCIYCLYCFPFSLCDTASFDVFYLNDIAATYSWKMKELTALAQLSDKAGKARNATAQSGWMGLVFVESPTNSTGGFHPTCHETMCVFPIYQSERSRNPSHFIRALSSPLLLLSALLDHNRKLPIAVGSCGTSSASCGLQWALPDLRMPECMSDRMSLLVDATLLDRICHIL